jgi:exosome complex component RRP42
MAEGSAQVELGNTMVLAGIKMLIGEPYPDSPDKGVLATAAELIPLASPTFEAGPPRENAIELARVVDRGIREANVIQLDKLCIEPEEKVWVVFMDLHILDYDGNLFDACSLAALSALHNTIIPNERLDLGKDEPLPLDESPISCTFVKFDGAIVIDPSLDEEEIADARLTLSLDKEGSVRALQKGLKGTFTVKEINNITKIAQPQVKKIRKLLGDKDAKKQKKG